MYKGTKKLLSEEESRDRARTKVAFYKLSGDGGVKINEDLAVVLLEERVRDRDGEAMWMLGLCCEYGRGTERDIERAEKLYEKSSERRNVVGEFLKQNNESGRGNGTMKVKCLHKEQYLICSCMLCRATR